MHRIIATLIATTAISGAAGAATVIGLAGDRTIVRIDPASAAVTGMIEVSGADRLLGIDYRPANGTLIGVTDNQTIVTIDPETGAATEIAAMTAQLPIAEGAPVIVDVNPAADKLRFMSGTTNHRVDMDSGEATVDGALNWAEGDANAGAPFMVAGTGYTNSHGKPETTAMFNIDAALSSLLQQTAPNDGTNATIGSLGVALEGPIGFDVAADGEGANTAWLAALGGLHTVDLETGAVSESWQIDGLDVALRDITVWPSM
ncbi:DUF4394 domain-containing protein [Paracoccus spongiarum]|uniref:DUF4394 domain-containing protein n=1 Tax=Paracoccus spongiarum TaxID=3064387 RepID=A0ABT9J7I2_9RHOB|nr:DUF4394 domain-containing protein [Paracoccus sp. 2205BS29-5]MDP5305741.1 DUF4394 domain-containing protein [Paracoccus sp. 2205BS29-5]